MNKTIVHIPVQPHPLYDIVYSDDENERRDGIESVSSPPVVKNEDCTVKSTDMNEDLQQQAIAVTLDAMNKFRVEKDIATYIKEEFDRRYQPTWHCVVGRNFGSFVTHETNHFIYFYVQNIAIMLFKTGF